jgi:hypothetical protein
MALSNGMVLSGEIVPSGEIVLNGEIAPKAVRQVAPMPVVETIGRTAPGATPATGMVATIGGVAARKENLPEENLLEENLPEESQTGGIIEIVGIRAIAIEIRLLLALLVSALPMMMCPAVEVNGMMRTIGFNLGKDGSGDRHKPSSDLSAHPPRPSECKTSVTTTRF